MAAKVNEVITGTYDHVGKSVIYGDTDSVYFSAFPILKADINNGNIPGQKIVLLSCMIWYVEKQTNLLKTL